MKDKAATVSDGSLPVLVIAATFSFALCQARDIFACSRALRLSRWTVIKGPRAGTPIPYGSIYFWICDVDVICCLICGDRESFLTLDPHRALDLQNFRSNAFGSSVRFKLWL